MDISNILSTYEGEILKRLENPRKDFKTEANDLFGFNGSNIPMDEYTDLFHKYQYEMGIGNNIIAIFDDWILNRLPVQITSKTKETLDGNIRYFDNVTFHRPFQPGVRKEGEDYSDIPSNMVPMYPVDAINSGETYAITVYVDVYVRQDNVLEEDKTFRTRIFEKMEIGRIPILKNSHFCWLRNKSDHQKVALDECFNDPQGYFILKGAEKASISQQKGAASQMTVKKIAQITNPNLLLPSVSIYCLLTNASMKTQITVDIKNSNIFNITIFDSKNCPVFLMFILFDLLLNGTPTLNNIEYVKDLIENDIMEKILYFVEEEDKDKVRYHVSSSIVHTIDLISELASNSDKEELLDIIIEYMLSIQNEIKITSSKSASTKMKQSRDVISSVRSNVFATIPVTNPVDTGDFEIRKIMLAKMTSIMARHMAGVRLEDDRDATINSRIYTTGREMEVVFNSLWKKELENWKISSSNVLTAGAKISTRKLNDGFVKELVTGTGVGSAKNPFTEAMKRETPMAVYSQLHRVTIEIKSGARLDAPRQLQPTQLGYICSGETPEGANCGILKNLTTTCWISIPREDRGVEKNYLEFLSDISPLKNIPLMYNGIIQGWVSQNDFEIIWDRIKHNRETFDVGVCYNRIDNHIDIFTDGSRVTRPLLVVDRKTGLLKIESYSKEDLEKMSILDMVEEGLVEFILSNENEMYLDLPKNYTDKKWLTDNDYKLYIKIAEYPGDVENLVKDHRENMRINEQPYTHSEIIPYAQFGIAASCIPAAAHNHGPRITYQSSMSKQALSGYHSNHHIRFDTSFKRQIAPSRTFFETDMYQPIGLNAMPSTDTPIIAILAHPVNNEDSIVVKKEFLDHHFNLSKYTTHKIEIRQRERIGIPPEEEARDKKDKYSALYKPSTDPDVNPEFYGLPKIGAFVSKGKAILGRISTTVDKDNEYKNIVKFDPVTIGIGKEGYIDRVDVTKDSLKTRIVRIKIVQYRRQIAGDKMASRYSQKGTFGLVLPANKMPRISSGPNKGIVPDFIFNPHGIPSRMTQGKIMEILATKAVIYTGEKINASPFVMTDMEYYRNILESKGLDKNGEEEMVHHDGTPLLTKVFIGACAYQCLKHHVLDKFQKRNVGKFNPLTHQPVRGRFNEGGLKFGEMEHDAGVSHGTSAFIADRLMESSDIYKAVCCKKCGNLAVSNFDPERTKCLVCNDKTNFGVITIPYIALLTNRMLNAIGIHMHFKFD